MPSKLNQYFDLYPAQSAPFLHEQHHLWAKTKPLSGLTVLNHVPVVPNTLLKITNLVVAGAKVVVTNPSFLVAHPNAVTALLEDGIEYVEDLTTLNQNFDIYFDCGAELFQTLGPPRIGSIELTASGDNFYRQQNCQFPIISVDRSYTKQLETLFGAAVSTNEAIAKLTNQNLTTKKWLIFGFGKIGRGIGYFCHQYDTPLCVVDPDDQARASAQAFNIEAIDPQDLESLESAITNADIIVTATGKKAILNYYPKEWFQGKILANMGVFDEFGSTFSGHQVLNAKNPVNFILNDPTPIQYIDPELYVHNQVALELLSGNLSCGVSNLSKDIDEDIIDRWCQYHQFSLQDISKWFVPIT
jgi:adenosylhomocysteinase